MSHLQFFQVVRQRCTVSIAIIACVAVITPTLAAAENWPMWRYDAGRSAASANRLPTEELKLLWKRDFSPRQQAWDDPLNLDLMTYDRTFEPIVQDGRIFLSFNDQDKLLALDAASGRELWTFFADAPIRFAPVADNDQLFVCSDDGYLYCLQAATGELRWKFTAAPSPQKALGNKRIVSAWPARGGPVLYDDTVYFANSIWPFMGTFICALDAQTGAVRWINDSTGSQYIKQPHSAPSFAGVAPQGFLVATEQYLIVPGGRSVPAVFDRKSGEQLYFHLNEGGKGTGGSFVTVDQQHFYVHTRLRGTRAFDLKTGDKTAFMPEEPVVTDELLFSCTEVAGVPTIVAYLANQDTNEAREPQWSIPADGTGDLLLAGDYLVAAGRQAISMIRLSRDESGSITGGAVERELPMHAPVQRVVVAANQLIAVTEQGQVLAYGSALTHGSAAGESVPVGESRFVTPVVRPDAAQQIYQLLAAGDAQGYAYWYGECEPALAAAWARLSPFEQLAIIDSDPQRVNRLRRQLDGLGVYGKLTAHQAELSNFMAPEYTGQMIFISPAAAKTATPEALRGIYKSLRPYGGTLILLGDEWTETRQSWLDQVGLEQAEFTPHPLGIVVKRVGRLPGSADWTHQYGDVANSIKSNDSRVKLPLGILWFGGSSNMDVLPRHGHGPPQQVVGGRLFIEGMNSLSARDVYTGRILWKRDFDDLGTFDVYYDDTYEDTPLDPKYNQVHIPGANGRGTNYIVTDDRVYIIEKNKCRILDPATGEDLGAISLPAEDSGETAEWGYIGVYNNVLLGGLGFAMYRDRYELEFEADKELKGSKSGFGSKSLDRAASRALVAFDRYTGEQLWRVDAEYSFWHNGIVAGGNRVYCLDRYPQVVEDAMRRRGLDTPTTYRIIAVDHRDGQEQWRVDEGVFGTWLGYSEQHGLLLQATARASDRLLVESGKGMRVYNAGDGSLRWAKDDLEYSGPCVLHNDLIITNANSYTVSAGAFDIRTGNQYLLKNSITGQLEPWKITRAYGCNSIIASENLLTFRSGAAGYYDLLTDSGTGNLGGFRSSCTSNLIVADGVLNAPDYTRTCSCSYQNQTSLALVPMSDVEVWNVHPLVTAAVAEDTPIEVLGINFGAPGDRRDPQGTLWVEHPTVSGDPLPLTIEVNEQATPFLRHSSRVQSDAYDWVYASGLQNVRSLQLSLILKAKADAEEGKSKKKREAKPEAQVQTASSSSIPPGNYDVELFFALPEDSGIDGDSASNAGQAVEFEVVLQGGEFKQTIRLERGDGTATGTTHRGFTACAFKSVPVTELLSIEFQPQAGTPVLSGIRVHRR
jgi:outer membrane protein assembly factor BamB